MRKTIMLKMQRIVKATLVCNCALLLTIVFIDNIFAYSINYEYVQHVMSMDTTFKHAQVYWRAVHHPMYYHIALILIIIGEALASVLLWMGGVVLFKHIRSEATQFENAKQFSLFGLLVAILLFSFAFFTIGSQWFASWQSTIWNAKNAIMPFLILCALTYLVVATKDKTEQQSVS